VILIYKRAGKGKKPEPAQGRPEDIQVGDAVSYWDNTSAFSAGRVEKINAKAGVLRLEAVMYKDQVLRPARKLTFADIIKAERDPNRKVVTPPPPEPTAAAPTPEEPKPRDSRLPPSGTNIQRRYGNDTHDVLVLESTFEYRGKTYTHLSQIAQEIVGRPINGYAFFKLNP